MHSVDGDRNAEIQMCTYRIKFFSCDRQPTLPVHSPVHRLRALLCIDTVLAHDLAVGQEVAYTRGLAGIRVRYPTEFIAFESSITLVFLLDVGVRNGADFDSCLLSCRASLPLVDHSETPCALGVCIGDAAPPSAAFPLQDPMPTFFCHENEAVRNGNT